MQQVIKKSAHHRTDIQGLRAVAVLMVIAFHAGLPTRGGFTGVDIFFVISGFVITGLLKRELDSTNRIDFGKFYSRRIKRLLPALGVAILGTILLSTLFESWWGEQQETARLGRAASLFFANILAFRDRVTYFSTDYWQNPLIHTWSLAVEEQFYILFPVLIFVAWKIGVKIGNQRTALTTIIVMVFGSSLLLCISYSYFALPPSSNYQPDSLNFAFYSPATRAWEFAAGGLVAIFLGKYKSISFNKSRIMSVFGVLGILISFLFISAEMVFPGIVVVLPVASASLIIIANSTEKATWLFRLLSNKFMVWIGDRSYSLYLWHWPIISITHLAWPNQSWIRLFAAVISVLPAILSYRLIEQPLRKPTDHRILASLAIGALSIAIPLAASQMLLTAAEQNWWSENSKPPLRNKYFYPDRCTYDLICIDDPNNSGRFLAIIGDSHAGSMTNGFGEIAKSLNYGTLMSSVGSCPYGGFSIFSEMLYEYKSCPERDTEVAKMISETKPAVIVIMDFTMAFLGPGFDKNDDGFRFHGCGPEKTICPTVPELLDKRLAEWKNSLKNQLLSLTSNGSKVILTLPLPEHLTRLRHSVLRSDPTTTLKSIITTHQEPARKVMKELAQELDGVGIWDPSIDLCDTYFCYTEIDGVSMYRDDNHLSIDGSFFVEAQLKNAIILALDGKF